MKLLAPCRLFAVGLSFGPKTIPKESIFTVARLSGQYYLSINSLGGMIQ